MSVEELDPHDATESRAGSDGGGEERWPDIDQEATEERGPSISVSLSAVRRCAARVCRSSRVWRRGDTRRTKISRHVTANVAPCHRPALYKSPTPTSSIRDFSPFSRTSTPSPNCKSTTHAQRCAHQTLPHHERHHVQTSPGKAKGLSTLEVRWDPTGKRQRRRLA